MDDLIDLILENIPLYTYPRFRIRVQADHGDLHFGNNVFGVFDPELDGLTQIELDAYHFQLLHSASGEENLAGLASVVYWGHATSNDPRAPARATHVVTGWRTGGAVTPAIAALRTQQSRQAVSIGNYGDAIGALAPLCELGRTPFASKVIAFLCPENAGVCDNRIQRFLNTFPLQHALNEVFVGALNGVGRVSRPIIQQRYQSWCQSLAGIRDQIQNEHGLHLRAVDIERALFAAGAP